LDNKGKGKKGRKIAKLRGGCEAGRKDEPEGSTFVQYLYFAVARDGILSKVGGRLHT
jgi:hypothetical protein